jgi:hypothetical protein
MPKAQVVRADPPGMEEQDNASTAFMVDEWDRPMTCVELLRMMKEKPATKCAIHTYIHTYIHDSNSNGTKEAVEGNGGRRIRRYNGTTVLF